MPGTTYWCSAPPFLHRFRLPAAPGWLLAESLVWATLLWQRRHTTYQSWSEPCTCSSLQLPRGVHWLCVLWVLQLLGQWTMEVVLSLQQRILRLAWGLLLLDPLLALPFTWVVHWRT